jgi:hypothetical protein
MSMDDLDLNARIERYMNRELHPAAARAMAHEALDDSDLFEELTAVALVQAALESPATTDRSLAQTALDDEDLFDTLVARGAADAAMRTPPRRNYWRIAVAVAAAAAAGLLTFLLVRPHAQPVQQPPQQEAVAIVKPGVAPVVLLTAELQPAHSQSAPIFRGIDAASRAPKSVGAVVSIEDGMVSVNLGSLDGLAKGTELPVIRDRPIGGIAITTVFRDHARGKIVDGDAIRANDQVRVPSTAHLNAILQQVDALAANGNLKAARDVARNALAAGSPGETRRLLERLAALDYQAGAPDAAREHYEVAVNIFDQPPAASSNEKASTLASYGALSLLAGDRQRADELLQKALTNAPDATLRSQILHNIGVAAQHP